LFGGHVDTNYENCPSKVDFQWNIKFRACIDFCTLIFVCRSQGGRDKLSKKNRTKKNELLTEKDFFKKIKCNFFWPPMIQEMNRIGGSYSSFKTWPPRLDPLLIKKSLKLAVRKWQPNRSLIDLWSQVPKKEVCWMLTDLFSETYLFIYTEKKMMKSWILLS